ncbi:cytochrome P450 [Hypoxylon sp. FL1150]|nr:cytochrome P450 [Hypoxylon sp. FL1150]
MEFMLSFSSLCWILFIILVVYSGADAFLTYRNVRKSRYPLVGSPLLFAPRFVLNLIFAGNASKIANQGYQKFKDHAFQLVRGQGNIVLLPHCLLEELAGLPATVASPHGALEHDLLGTYTGLNVILDSRLHHSIVQRKLTPRLNLITPRLEKEINWQVKVLAPSGGEWAEFQPYDVFGKIAARLTAHAIVGPAFCNDPVWLDIAINYTENLFRTIVVLRFFPSWAHPVMSRLLPSYWKIQRYIRSAREVLGPRIQELLDRGDDGSSEVDLHEDNFNVLVWLSSLARGQDRSVERIAHTEVLLALASVHTTLLRMLNVLYDLTAHHEMFRELKAEIDHVASSLEGWHDPYDRLRKLDSVLRESQRMSPPTTLGLKRLFKTSYTFRNGLCVPKGTYACMPIYAIENDPLNTARPGVYDGLRSYRAYSEKQGILETDGNYKEFQFSNAYDTTVLNFGYGKYACPGRFFASLIIKMVMVKFITEYDFKFLPGTGRPANIEVHEFLFTWPRQKMLWRKKEAGNCPF